MRRGLLALAAVAAMVLALPAASSAWQYKFQDFFQSEGTAFSSGIAKVKKCSGGKIGTYDFRDFAQAGGGDTEFSVEITSKMSVRESWVKMKHVEVSAEGSPNIPPDIVDGVAEGLHDFFDTVFTRYRPKHDELEIRHGSLNLFGSEVLEPGEGATKFKPKPGC